MQEQQELIDTLDEIGQYLAGCFGHAAVGSEAEKRFRRWVKAVDEAIGRLKEEKA